MNEIEKEIESTNQMMTYFGNNIDKLPVTIQLQVITEFVKFSEALKPLYITSLAIRGDGEEVKNDD